MWAYESVFYQIYPLGFCGAPFENDGVLEHRILKVEEWVPHIKKLGANAIYFSPVFESDTHGYNTRDYTKIDTRLGTNEDFNNRLIQSDRRFAGKPSTHPWRAGRTSAVSTPINYTGKISSPGVSTLPVPVFHGLWPLHKPYQPSYNSGSISP